MSKNRADEENVMYEQMDFIVTLCGRLRQSVSWLSMNGRNYHGPGCIGDREHGKTAVKRKIIMLRQELLNLERMVENV